MASVKGEENELKLFLRLNEAELLDSGEYSVIARNSEGEATNSAIVTVKSKHSICVKRPLTHKLIAYPKKHFCFVLDKVLTYSHK